IALDKSQPDVIYKVCLEILQQYSFFNAFIATDDASEIYMQQLWHTVTYDLTAKTYCQIFKVNEDLLRDALLITLKDSDHPFTLPPPENEIITFINELGYSGPLTQIDATLRNLKLTNKGAKYPLFGIAIPMVMLNDEIKASADYQSIWQSLREENQKRGKGLLTKKGVEVEVPYGLSHKGPNEGSSVTPEFPNEPKGSSSSSNSESDDKIKDISSDDERS
nr:hypothetical protein [Tanacetum cinerariifolium]